MYSPGNIQDSSSWSKQLLNPSEKGRVQILEGDSVVHYVISGMYPCG